MRFARLTTAFGTSFLLAACATAHVDRMPSANDERLYDSLYPYYAEFCAVSQIEKKPGSGADTSGGPGGHSVLYLNGVCRDDGTGYPTVKMCDAASAPERKGVGLSVNAHFKNASWVATEGRDFFFHGTLAPDERLTPAAYERTQAKAKEMGILDGVEFHAEVFDDMPPGWSRRDYMYEVSIATDYAIAYGRDRYCARVPLSREKMARMVRYLNALNATYRDGKKDFEWDVFRNNCSHVTHNALAEAGVWDEWATHDFFLFAAIDFPVPKNEFVDLMRRTNDLPLDDVGALWRDAAARRSLLQSDGLPAEAGALAEAEPAVQNNDIYATDLSLIFYDDPIFGVYRQRFERIFAEPRYFDIRASLKHFSGLYRKARLQRKSVEAYLDHPPQDFVNFYIRYYEYVDRMSARVDAELAALSSTPPSAAAR